MTANLAATTSTKTSRSEPGDVIEGRVMSLPSNGIETTIDFATRDPKHETEKPYDLRYDTGGAIPKTNVVNETKSVTINDFRTVQDSSNYDTYGFSVERLDGVLSEAIFNDPESIKMKYYSMVETVLRRKYPDANGVYVLEHNLRKRHAQFPVLEQALQVEYTQPATLAHIDCSLESAVKTVRSAFSIPAAKSRRVVSINFWKSLQGRGNDWPLALCDARTLHHTSDTVVADVVYHNRFTENEFVYHNKAQEWWYVSDLEDSEIIMFLQKDSNSSISTGGGECDDSGKKKKSNNTAGVAHTSFYNPRVDKDANSRTSIEFRTFVVFS